MHGLTHRIFLGYDARDMSFLQDESVHLVVTSPPYWQLKDYGNSRQIGFHDSYETYINDLNLVWQECVRVLKPGCRVAINIGDQFARAECYGRYKVIPIRTEIIRALECMGLDHMGSIIWRKVTTCQSSGGGSVMGSFPTPRNGIVKLDYEFILLFKKPGRTPPPSREAREDSRLTTEEWNQYFAGHWEFPGEKQVGHVAMFPLELPHRLIRMFTFPGEVVLDPFLGSATTMLAGWNNNRQVTGIELNVDFEDMMREKLGLNGLFGGGNVQFLRAGKEDGLDGKQLEERRSTLPFVFTDPVRIERKKSPSAAGVSRGRAKTCQVRKVLSGNSVLLSDGRLVVLRGIVVPKSREADAREFLLEKTRGQQVMTHHLVEQAPDRLMAYLLLRNRTNLNAHLIKRGLALCDREVEHPMKARFLRYEAAPGQ